MKKENPNHGTTDANSGRSRGGGRKSEPLGIFQFVLVDPARGKEIGVPHSEETADGKEPGSHTSGQWRIKETASGLL